MTTAEPDRRPATWIHFVIAVVAIPLLWSYCLGRLLATVMSTCELGGVGGATIGAFNLASFFCWAACGTAYMLIIFGRRRRWYWFVGAAALVLLLAWLYLYLGVKVWQSDSLWGCPLAPLG